MKSGNRDFIEKLFREQEYIIVVKYAIAEKIPGMAQYDMEDCISNVFLAALKTKNLEEHPNIKGWLYITAQNIAKLALRDKYKHKVLVYNSAVVNDYASDKNFAKGIETKEFLDRLPEYLTDSELKLYNLKFVEGRSSKEISEILGIKVNSVDVSCTRLRKKIEKIMKKFLN